MVYHPPDPPGKPLSMKYRRSTSASAFKALSGTVGGLVLLCAALTPAHHARANDADAALDAFFTREWDYRMEESPLWASSLGDLRWNDRLGDFSLAAIERNHRHDREALERLRALPVEGLSARNRENREIFLGQLQTAVDGQRFPYELMPVNQQYSLPSGLSSDLAQAPLDSVRHVEDYIARLRQVPRALQELQEVLAEGARRGITPPRAPLAKVEPQLRALATQTPEKSVFVTAIADLPSSIPEEARKKLQAGALEAVRDDVIPAYGKLLAFWTRDYYPRTRESIAISDLPDGKAWYAHAVRNHTTTDMTPEAIHALGLSEVKRIRAAMENVKAETGFKGSMEDFFRFLRTDPRFYYTDAPSLLRGYRDICKRIDAGLPRLFGTLPRLPYGVAEIPAHAAPSATTAYYQPGSPDAGRAGLFYANTYRLETRPTWEMEALSAHESVPGHHLQIALAQELEGLPKFRTESGFTAFVEGWGLYSESLGQDLGLYQDPYSRFGQLTYEMWRAVRLVVDTGIHAFGWSRQQSIDYFMQNAGKQEHDVTVEVDRYITWPGQALAYKIGQLKIRELRTRAESALGERFDIRAFHDVVLGSGAVPLAVLERNIDAWISTQHTGNTQQETPET